MSEDKQQFSDSVMEGVVSLVEFTNDNALFWAGVCLALAALSAALHIRAFMGKPVSTRVFRNLPAMQNLLGHYLGTTLHLVLYAGLPLLIGIIFLFMA